MKSKVAIYFSIMLSACQLAVGACNGLGLASLRPRKLPGDHLGGNCGHGNNDFLPKLMGH